MAETIAMTWAVPTKYVVAEAAGAAAFLLAALFAGDGITTVVGLACAAVLGVIAARDALLRPRLAAGPDGLRVVAGPAGRHALAWDQIERVSAGVQQRHGLRSALLEIDTADRLYVLSPRELGADPTDVARTVNQLRRPPT
jgi:Bacterial PH domain